MEKDMEKLKRTLLANFNWVEDNGVLKFQAKFQFAPPVAQRKKTHEELLQHNAAREKYSRRPEAPVYH